MKIPQIRATVAVTLLSLMTSSLASSFETAQPAAAQAIEQSSNELLVTAGKSVIVNSSLPIERISVGFGDIAEATAVSPLEVLVNGKAPGETTLIIWQRGGSKQFFDLTVRPSRFLTTSRLDGVRREMSKELPDQNITLSFENDMVFMRGAVKDLTSADRAVAIASTLGKVVNLLYVDVPSPQAQILLKVRFASVDRNLSNQLGINIFSTGATNTIGSTSTGQFSPVLPSSTLSTTSPGTRHFTGSTTLSDALNLFFFRPDLNLGATIQALEVKGILEVLAEPNVLAESGKPASFLAGGEFPFPTVQGIGAGTGTGAVTIQFKQFGIRLNFIPTLTPSGTIHLQVAPEVSALDFTNGLVVQGFNVPALTVRRVNTDVDLSEGQSFAIGGLLDNRVTDTFEKIPFIGDVPILGKFFQSRSRNKTNTELLVIVTPEIVRPIPAGQPVPGLNYPMPFLQPNTGKDMRTPGQNVTGSVPVTPPSKSIPVEKLIESLQPEKPLAADTSSNASSSGLGQNQGSQAMPAVPPK